MAMDATTVSRLLSTKSEFAVVTSEPLQHVAAHVQSQLTSMSAVAVTHCPFILIVKLKTVSDSTVLDKMILLHDPKDLYQFVGNLGSEVALHSIDLLVLHPTPGSLQFAQRIVVAITKRGDEFGIQRHRLISDLGLGFEYPDEPVTATTDRNWNMEIRAGGLVQCTPLEFSKVQAKPSASGAELT